MKIRKALVMFAATALLAAAVLPFSASAAENYVNLIGVEDQIKNNTDGSYLCAFDINDGVLTLTVSDGNTDGRGECYTMAETFDTYEFDFEAMPNLYWDVSGNAAWDLWMRCNTVDETDPDAGLIKLSTLSGNPDGVDVGTGSINLYEAIMNDDVITMVEPENTTLRVVKYVVYGQPGDSIDINSLYFAAEEQSDITANTGSASSDDDSSSSDSASSAAASSSSAASSAASEDEESSTAASSAASSRAGSSSRNTSSSNNDDNTAMWVAIGVVAAVVVIAVVVLIAVKAKKSSAGKAEIDAAKADESTEDSDSEKKDDEEK